MKTINFRLLFILLAACVAVGVGVHFLHGYQFQRQLGVFQELATQAEREGKPLVAADYLRRYHYLKPDDDEAVVRYALLLADHAEPAQAILPLIEAVNRQPDRDDLRRRLADLLYEVGKSGDVITQINQYLDPDGKDAKLQEMLGVSYYRQHQVAPAIEALQRAIALDPSRVESYGYLAGIEVVERKDFANALRLLDAMVEANPTSSRAYVIRGAFFAEQARVIAAQNAVVKSRPDSVPPASDEPVASSLRTMMLQLAFADGEHAAELGPHESEALVFAAQSAHSAGEFDRARIHAECAKAEFPELPTPYALLADLDLREGNSGTAMELLREGIANAGKEAGLLWNLANLEISEENVEAARGLMDQLREQGPSTQPLVTYLEARIEIEQQQWNNARSKLEQVRTQLALWPELTRETNLWLGFCYQALGHRDLTLAAFQRATSDDPFWTPGLVGEAAALLSSGRWDEALEKYRMAASFSNATPAIRLAYTSLLIATKRQEPAESPFWDAISRNLDSIRNMPDLKEEERRSVEILTAEALAARGAADEAESHLRAAMVSDPHGEAYWLALSGLQQRRLDWPGARATLDEAQSLFGETVDQRASRAVLEFSRLVREEDSRDEMLEVLRTLACPPEDFSAEQSVELASRMAPLLMYAKDFETAETLLSQVATAEPTNLQVRLLLFDLALMARSATQMEPILAQVAEIEPGSPIWNYGTAIYHLLLAEQNRDSSEQAETDNQPAEAQRLLQEAQQHLADSRLHLEDAIKIRPQWQKANLLRARILEDQGQTTEAVAAYEAAIGLGARDPESLLRLIAIYLSQSSEDSTLKAKRVLMKLSEDQTPYSAQFARAATQIATELGPENEGLPVLEMAVRLARDAARGSPNADDHLVLGYLLRTTDTFDEAELEFREAIRIDPTLPEPWLHLIELLVSTGKTDDATTALDEALPQIRPESVHTTAGRAYEMLKDLELASARFEEALAGAPGDVSVIREAAEYFLRTGQLVRASELLSQLSALDAAASASGDELQDVQWGRRNLAALLVTRGGYANLQAALQLVDANLEGGTNQPEDDRVKAIVLSSMSTRALRVEAISILERLIQTKQSTGQDRFILAQLHLAEAAWYRSQLLPALADGSQPPENDAPSTAAAQHFSAAIPLLQSAIAAEPNSPGPLLIYADALLSRGQPSEAMLLMSRLVAIATNSRAAMKMAARILIANRKPREALEFVQLRIPVKINQDSAEATLQVAELLEELFPIAQGDQTKSPPSGEETSTWTPPPEDVQAFLAESERLYRELSAIGPRYQLVLSGYLSRRGRLDEAVALIEAHAAEPTPEDLANACVHLMREAHGETTQLRRAEQILAAAQERNPDSAAILVCRADVLAWLEDVETSESLYRRVLELVPAHAAASNNLAFLLAAQGKSLDEALAQIDAVIAVQGPLPELLDTRAYVRMQRNEPQDAINDLTSALGEQRSSVFQFHLAQAQAMAEQMESARETWLLVANAKLAESDVHPLERAEYRDLSAQLALSGRYHQ